MELPPELLEPIEGANPAGEGLRYELIYDEIRHARKEDEEIPQGDWKTERKTADFRSVIRLAEDALSTQTKDLQIAAWYTEALLRERGFPGLRAGVDLIREFLERFWDHVYPEIEDPEDIEFRATPLEWVAHYLEPSLLTVPLNGRGHNLIDYRDSRALGYEKDAADDYDKQQARQAAIAAGELTAEDFDSGFNETPKPFYKALVADIDAALEAIDALEAVGDEKFEDIEIRPSYAPLRDSINEVRHVANQLLTRKLELDPDPIEVEAPSAPEASQLADAELAGDSGAGVGSPAPSTPGPVSAEPRSRDDAAGRIGSAARYLRSVDPTDPAPYAMLRGFRWAELRSGGERIDPRLLEAPPTQIRTRLKGLLLDGEWAQLLEAGEGVMATPFGRGWLDLQRYVLTALDGLGSSYEAVASVISGALRELLRVRPELLDMTLMDDSPTANRETRGWLASRGLLPDGTEAPETAAQEARPRESGSVLRDRALQMVQAGNPRRAVQYLMAAAEQENNPRAQFLRRSEAASIMVDHGLEAVAHPMLQQMMEQIEAHQLESWEDGEVVARPMGLLYRLLSESDPHTSQTLYLRICRLDPVLAMELGSEGEDADTGAAEAASPPPSSPQAQEQPEVIDLAAQFAQYQQGGGS